MKNTMKKILNISVLTLVMALSGLSFAGQHSGLGGTPPPSPRPAPDPSVFATLEEYYRVYAEWLRQQMESTVAQDNAAMVPNVHD